MVLYRQNCVLPAEQAGHNDQMHEVNDDECSHSPSAALSPLPPRSPLPLA